MTGSLFQPRCIRARRGWLGCLGAAGILAAGCLAAEANRVTYQVDMSVQRAFGNFVPDRGDQVLVSGTFSTTNWTTNVELSPNPGHVDLYQGTFSNGVAAGAWEQHKFIIRPGGDAASSPLIWESGNNRSFRVTASDQLLPVVYFDNESESLLSAQVTFRVSLEQQAGLGQFDPATDTVSMATDVLGAGGMTTAALTNSVVQPLLWQGTFNVTTNAGTLIRYRFAVHPQGGAPIWEDDDIGPGGSAYREGILNRAAMVLPWTEFNNVRVEPEFIAGADMSHLVFFEDRGVEYRVDGDVQDALALLHDRGVNCVRLRVFTSSDEQAMADPYNYTNNLSYTLPLAVRVKDAGMKLMLDFHYSDTWADPGKQTKPAEWAGLGFVDLVTRIRAYSSNTVAALDAAGAMPDYVQLGNEITPGLLWNDGRVGGSFDRPAQWQKLAELLTSAALGVHDAAGANMPKLLIHIAAGGDWGATRWYFDNLEAHHVPFDIIAQSYYPWWHGSPDALHNCLTNTAARYGRPIMVVETAFPWAGEEDIYGFPPTPQGQVDFTVALGEIVQGVSDGKGIGIFWWGTEYQAVPGYNLAAFNQRSFFGSDGNVLPVATAFGQLAIPVRLSVALQDHAVVLHWSSSAAGVLQRTTDVPANTWLDVEGGTITNGPYSIIAPLDIESFRLRKP